MKDLLFSLFFIRDKNPNPRKISFNIFNLSVKTLGIMLDGVGSGGGGGGGGGVTCRGAHSNVKPRLCAPSCFLLEEFEVFFCV